MDILLPFIIAIGVVVLTGLIMWGMTVLKNKLNIKKNNINRGVDIASLILVFINNKLKNSNNSKEKQEQMLNSILNVLDYIKDINNEVPREELIASALSTIEENYAEYGEVLSDDDKLLIKTLLELASDFYESYSMIENDEVEIIKE